MKTAIRRYSSLEPFPEALLNAAKIVQLRKGDFLFHCGDLVDSVFFVLEGEVRGLRTLRNGNSVVMMRAGENEFFATASLIMRHFPCSAYAAVRSRVLRIPRNSFEEAMEESGDFACYFAICLSKSLKQQCSLAERLRLKSARDRILHYIACESSSGKSVTLKTSLASWADELGIEPESLYRTLSEMESAGEITRSGKSIELAPSGE